MDKLNNGKSYRKIMYKAIVENEICSNEEWSKLEFLYGDSSFAYSLENIQALVRDMRDNSNKALTKEEMNHKYKIDKLVRSGASSESVDLNERYYRGVYISEIEDLL